MIQKKTIRLFILLVFVLPVIAYFLLSWYEKNLQHLPVLGKKPVGEFSFINQNGDIISEKKWENRIVVANFFFTHCPAICPQMTINIKKIAAVYEKDDRLVFASFTVDPERDSPVQLKDFANKYEILPGKWDLLTGDKRSLYRFARNELMIVATDGDGGPADFIHSEKLVLIDKNKQIRGFYTGTDTKEINQLIKDIKRLKNDN